MADDKAAFGVFPQMKPRRSKQDREAAKSFPLDVARGFVAGSLGAPADILNIPAAVYSMATGKDMPYEVPYGSEHFQKILPGKPTTPTGEAASGLGALAGGFYTGPGSGIRAAMAVPKAAVKAGKDFIMAAPQGAPRMFIGPKAKTWDQAKADRAAQMEKEGKDPVDIWRETGTFRSADGILRQEISDVGAVHRNPTQLKELGKQKKEEAAELQQRLVGIPGQKDMFPKALTEAKRPVREKVKTLKEEADELMRHSDVRGQRAKFALEHPELYKAYPELGEIPVYQGNRGIGGERASIRGGPQDLQMEITQSGLRADPRSSALHEMQHAIQTIEGMGPGGSPSMAYGNPKAFEILEELRKRALEPMTFEEYSKQLSGRYSQEELTEAYKRYVDSIPGVVKKMDRELQQQAAMEYYRRLAGEAEARATQAREPLTQSQRAIEFPYSSYDVLPEDLIVNSPKSGGLSLQTVYHGSPHKFEKFDASKIGSGEGAQAYGHGLYFAESPGVAKSYQETLSKGLDPIVGGEPFNKFDPVHQAATALHYNLNNPEAALITLNGMAKNAPPELKPIFHQAEKLIDVGTSRSALPKVSDQSGHLYTVDLPDEKIARMLDWDKPLSQQPEVIKALKGTDYEVGMSQKQAEKVADERLRQEAYDWADETGGDPVDFINNADWEKYVDQVRKESGSVDSSITGKDLHRMIMRDEGYRPELFDPENYQIGTSEALRNYGIPGIKYLDATSRDAGKGTSNFVVFPGEEEALTILERKKEGGSVHISDNADAQMMEVMDKKMAGGGLLKALKGVQKALPQAEREANLAKLLEPSKVKERLYHGTTATEGGKGQEAIRKFKPSKEGALGSGVYLTPSPAKASRYSGAPNEEMLAEMRKSFGVPDQVVEDLSAGKFRPDIFGPQEGGNMLPVYAQIKNPLVLEGKGDPMIEALIKLGVDEATAGKMVERAYETKGYIGKEVESRARAAGYDGLMQYRNGELTEVVSYNPNAIKSATGNVGTYDVTSPDLSKAKGGRVSFSDNLDAMMMDVEDRKMGVGGLLRRGAKAAKSEPALPLELPRAPAKTKEEIRPVAQRMAQQMTGEFVRPNPKKSINPAGKSLKQFQMEKELTHDIRPAEGVTLSPQQVADIEKQLGMLKIGVSGDTTIADQVLYRAGPYQLDLPSPQHGGPLYALGGEGAWASNNPTAATFQKRVQELSRAYGDAPTLGQFVAMGPEGSNFALHLADANLRAIDLSKMTKSQIEQANDIIRQGTAKSGPRPGFPGIEDKESAYLHFAFDPELRKAFNAMMNKPDYTSKLNLPDGRVILHAVTEPELRNTEILTSGRSQMMLDPSVASEALALSKHPTYSHVIPKVSGSEVSRTKYPIPAELEFPDVQAYIRENVPKKSHTRMYQTATPRQIIDQQHIDEMKMYEELMKEYTGKKKGGEVSKAAQIDGNEFVLAAQKYGLKDDINTLNKLVALVNQGATVDEAARVVAETVEMAGGGLAKGLKAAVKAAKEAPIIVVPSKLGELQAEVAQKAGQYGAKRVQRAADEIKNLEKMYNRQALRETFLGDNAKAVVTMNPADFEKYAQALSGRTQADIGPKMAELARQGEIDKYTVPTDEYIQHLMRVQGGFDQVPYLNLFKDEVGLPTKPQIKGHEGRHRSRALAQQGEESSLVKIDPRGDLYEGLPRRSQEEYIKALRQELERSGRLVLPEVDGPYRRSAIELPEPYAKGGAVKKPDNGLIKVTKKRKAKA